MSADDFDIGLAFTKKRIQQADALRDELRENYCRKKDPPAYENEEERSLRFSLAREEQELSYCGKEGRRCGWYPGSCDWHDERGDWEYHCGVDDEMARGG